MPTAETLRERRDRARESLDHLTESLAERVAELEAIEEKIARKTQARETHEDDDERRAELHEQIRKLVDDRRTARDQVGELEGRVRRTRKRVKRIARQLRNRVSPKVVDLGFDRTAVRPLARQTTLGTVVGHYTAGPLDDDGDDESFALWRAYDRAHKAQGWACLGYNIGVTRLGTVVRLRGIEWVGAHTLNWNTGHPGISVHGTTGHTWTKAQLRGLRHALKHYGLKDKAVIGHREAPGQSTACPGSFLAGYKAKGKP